MSWRKFLGNLVKVTSKWEPVEDLKEWPHFRHPENHLIRVFPPVDGSGRWMVATYEKRENELHPVHHRVFEGEDAEIDAFCFGVQLAVEDRAGRK